MVITHEQAEKMLRAEILNDESYIQAVVTKPINQQMFDALLSFVYNIGQGNFQKSSVLKLLNIGDYYSSADGFLLWDRSAGMVTPLLKTRRSLERQLYLAGVEALLNGTAAPTNDAI